MGLWSRDAYEFYANGILSILEENKDVDGVFYTFMEAWRLKD